MGPAQSLCGNNILNNLYQQYGLNTVIQFITIEKSKFFIDDQFTILTRKFHQAFLQFQTSIKQTTSTKTKQLSNLFDSLKNKANSILPGGVAVLQRVKGQSINQFSGFNNLLTQIQTLKSQSLANLSLKKTQMMSQIEQQKVSMVTGLTQTQPKIPLYEQIPQPLKKSLFVQIEKKFSEEIKRNQTQLTQKIMGLFNGSALYGMFQEMSPLGMIDKMISSGLAQIERSILSNIGGTGFFGGNSIELPNFSLGGDLATRWNNMSTSFGRF